MKAHAKILRNHPAFARFSNRTINRLAAHSRILEYAKGTVITQSGDPADAMFLVLSGRCQAHVVLPDGSEQILDIYAPGDTFGERALVSGERHWATVKVITDCVLLRIDGEDVNYLFDRSPKLARQLVLRLVDQLNAYRQETHREDLGRVIIFAEVSSAAEGSVVVENVCAALARETDGLVLYARLSRDREHALLLDWPGISARLSERIMKSGPGEVDTLRLGVSDDAREPELIAPLVGELARHYRYVVGLLDGDVPPGAVMEAIEQADCAYILFRQTSDDLYKTNLLLRHCRDLSTKETQVLPVVVLEYEERALPFETLRDRLGREVHGVVHGLPRQAPEDPHTHYVRSAEGRFSSHIRRLAREIGRCRVGLALSSGGAKGFAHVGVIQVLEEHGIHVDVVVGTSMGAYVGALWCYGLHAEEMAERALDMARPGAFLRLIDPVIPPRRGFMRGFRIRKLLQKSIGDAHFSDLVKQLRVMATDLNTLERIVFDSGEVAPCVHASTAMPGVFTPLELGGRTIIDGGIADPLPVDVLLEMQVERIIAVNTVPNPEDMRRRVEMGREMAAMGRRHARLAQAIGRYVNYFAPGNILDIMMRGIHGAQTRVAEGACKQADVVLRPTAPTAKWNDFSNAREYLDLGRRVAEEKLDELKALTRH